MYSYIKTEPSLWTAGFYAPDGKWVPESDHENIESAAARVSFLNGNAEKLSYEQWEGEVKVKGGFVYADRYDAIENVVTDLGREAVWLLGKFVEADVVEFLKEAGYEVMTDGEFDYKIEDARQEGRDETVPVCSWDRERDVNFGKRKLGGGGNMHKQPALDALEEIVEKKGWQFLAELLKPHTLMCVNVAG